MDTLKRYRLYAGALCVYDLSGDAVFETMQKIFQNQDDEAFIPLQRDLCRLLLAAGSLEEYLLNAVLTNDNAFTRAAAAGKEKELPQAVQKSVVADLKKLSQLCTFSAADIFSAADDPDVRQVLTTMPAWTSSTKCSPNTTAKTVTAFLPSAAPFPGAAARFARCTPATPFA